MAKDPALLVYTKDFLEGTADLSVEEFGAFTRLIFHQHQRGILPSNLKKLARLCGVSYSEFQEIWKEINVKFTQSEDGYINERCAGEIARRSHGAIMNSVKAVYGNWIKANNRLTKTHLSKIKEAFSIDEFLNIVDEAERKSKITETLDNLKEAFAKRPHKVNGNGNGNGSLSEEETVTAEIYPTFDDFWNLYDKKVGKKEKIKSKWEKLSHKTKLEIVEYIPKYIKAQPDKQYRKNPETFLNNESWKDELISNEKIKSNNNSEQKGTIYSEDFYRKHTSGFSPDDS